MRFFKILLWKAYFDKGFALTNYLKYVLLVFGWATNDIKTTIIVGVSWCFSCLIIGKLWFKYRLVDTEQEINNLFNPFCHDVRNALSNGTLLH